MNILDHSCNVSRSSVVYAHFIRLSMFLMLVEEMSDLNSKVALEILVTHKKLW